ncbi:MAG: RagB/SusD family nutrient uptake outer membrane protein [Bacteroidales bacterium]|nr:RagB/SusD family nutrient uptake outer membrane protein [Bacteroidales bacterium]
MKYIKYLATSVFCLIFLASCGEKFMEVNNTEYLDDKSGTMKAYILGACAFMVKTDISGDEAHDDFSHMSVLHSTDLMGQDIALSAPHWFVYDYDHDNHENNYRRTKVDWLTYYNIIATANQIINCSITEKPTTPESKGLLAHGYALRAFAYYYLIQLYQHPVTASGEVNYDAPGVPMLFCEVDSLTNEEATEKKGRNTVREVYEQIEKDLMKAVQLFSAGYKRPSKIFMDLSVANGLLARYYLLSQQWQKAADAAAAAYEDYTLDSKSSDKFVDIEHPEWMWGFDQSEETQTTVASFFSHISSLSPGYAGYAYSVRLIDRSLYEAIPETDYRKKWFNGAEQDTTQKMAAAKLPYANLKFGWIAGWLMDYMYMRVPEMYLIQAEALAHLDNTTGAADALRPLMALRDPGWHKTSMTVDEIYFQRRIELWGEGFSFFDLKRLNKGINRNYSGTNHLVGYRKVIAPLDKTWVYQIPLQEMQENTQLTATDQNE